MAAAKEDQDKIALWSANSDRQIFTEAFYEDMMTDARPGLAQLKIPVLVLWPYYAEEGKASDIEKAYVTQWSKAPQSKVVKVENSHHFIMLDQPEAFDRALQDFLK